MSAVLKIASDPAIFDAILISFAMKMAIVKVLQMAKSLQTKAFIKDRPAPSAPDFLPAWDLFIIRSPMNIVNALERKSDPTIDRAVEMDPENFREVMNVTLPAMTRHINALTAERAVVSEKFAAGDESKVLPFK